MVKDLVVFKVKDTLFGINTDKIESLNRDLNVTKNVQSKHYIDGLVSFRKEVITQISIEQFLFNTGTKCDNTFSIVYGTDSYKVALRIDDIIGVIKIDDSDIIPVDSLNKNTAYMIDGYVLNDNKEIIQLINVESIVKDMNDTL